MSVAYVRIKFGDERLTVPEAARRIGINRSTLMWRLRQGWPKEKLLSPENFIRGKQVRPKPVLREQSVRDLKQLRQIVQEHGSPFRAALEAQLSAEEYLLMDELSERRMLRTLEMLT